MDSSYGTTWSYMYYEVQNHTLNCTKITPNGTGYYVCGYFGLGVNPTDPHYPFVMEIDESGNILQHSIGEQKGVFLDVETTSDGGCIAVGFTSGYINEIEPNTGRRALIVKFSSTLVISWAKMYISVYTQTNPRNEFFDIAENVTVINSTYTGFTDCYFIMGSVSGVSTTIPTYTAPYLAFCFIDNSGNLTYTHTTLIYGNSFDATYDDDGHKLYYVGKKDAKVGDQYGVIGRIDISTGTIDYQKSYEGSTQFPFVHISHPNKIELDGDYFWIFGYVRNYVLNSTSSPSFDIMIPYYAKFQKSNASNILFYINDQDTIHTRGYPSLEPGFLHSWDNITSVFSARYTSVYSPESAIAYLDNLNNFQFGMIGYFNVSNPAVYKLHYFSSELEFCDPFERNISIYAEPTTDIDMVFENFEYTTSTKIISKSSVPLTDDDC